MRREGDEEVRVSVRNLPLTRLMMWSDGEQKVERLRTWRAGICEGWRACACVLWCSGRVEGSSSRSVCIMLPAKYSSTK